MSCCKKCISSEPDSVIKICWIIFNIGSIIFNIGMILFEILDKYVDIAAAVEYHKGRLFYNPNESVYRALLAFTIIGGIISFIIRIPLYVWRIYLNCTGNKSYDKCYDDFSLGTQSIKVILEVFPQSVIAKFYFVHCPIKKYGWGIWLLDPAFDGFCGAPFIVFLCYLCFYGCKHILRIKCCDGRDENEESLKNVFIRCTTLLCSCFVSVLFITVALSVVGLVFASLSLSEFSKRRS